MHWLWVGIIAGRVLRQRQCILEGHSMFMHEVVYTGGSIQNGEVCTQGHNFFHLSLKLT